ncbi:MAG: hypothetical protein JNK53_02125 [Phycisphaerae bacterium]|nr:hypothetical protein [Phycisphaerae bacterium]
MFIGLMWPGSALAGAHAGTQVPPAAKADARPEVGQAVQAYLTARAWLDAGSIPSADPAATDGNSTIQSAAVVLRLNGRVVGMGKAIGPAPDLLARSVQSAASNARQDAAVRALGEQPLARLTLELELGGAPQALVGGTFEQALATLQPAAQGLALRHGDRWAYLPIGHVLARGMAAPLSRSVLALITELQLPPRDLPELRTAASTALYAVPSIRLVQSTCESTPIAIERLTPSIAAAPASDADAARTAWAIAHRLHGQVAPRDTGGTALDETMRATLAKLGLRGAYDPLADEEREVTAAPADQALCAYALARGAACAHWTADQRAQSRAAAVAILRALESIEPGEANPTASLPAAAFTLLALGELERSQSAGGAALEIISSPAWVQALTKRVRSALSANTEPEVNRALALAAAAARLGGADPVLSAAECRAQLTAQWEVLRRASALTVAPWLMVAERGMARSPKTTNPAAAELDLVLAALVGTQSVTQQDRSTAPDTWGAYPVTDATGARATAQSARPMHFAALMRVELPSTTPDGPAAIDRSLRSAARFLAQLQVGPDMAYALRSPERATGGIMAAPYDPSILPAAQGMALLALLEMLDNRAVSAHSVGGGE